MEKQVTPGTKSLEQVKANATDFAAVSIWWLSIPLFIVMMLLIKEAYIPGSAFVNDIHEFLLMQKNTSLIFFLISPLIMLLVNGLFIMKIRSLTENPRSAAFLTPAWPNVMVLIFCLVVFFIYSL